MSRWSIDLFNDDGDLEVEIGSESDETVYEAPIPPAGGAAGDAGLLVTVRRSGAADAAFCPAPSADLTSGSPVTPRTESWRFLADIGTTQS